MPIQNLHLSPKVRLQLGSSCRSSLISASSLSSERTITELRRLVNLAIPQRKRLALGIGLLFISSSVSLSVPLTLGKIVDIFTNPDHAALPVSLPVAVAALLGIFAIGACANTGRVILMRIAGQRIIADARISAFSNVMKQVRAGAEICTLEADILQI